MLFRPYIIKIKNLIPKFLLLFLFHVLYNIAGAFLFYHIEECKYNVQPKLSPMKKGIYKICDNITNSNNHIESLPLDKRPKIERILEKCKIVLYYKHLEHGKCEMNFQTFGKWYRFAVSVCITVGFGDIHPRSDVGKKVLMIYAVPGIMLTLSMYFVTAEILIIITEVIILFIEFILLKRIVIHQKRLKVCILQISILLCLIFINTGLHTLSATENYSFLDSLYFNFIMLSTVGLGDFIPKTELYMDKFIYLFTSLVSFLSQGMAISIFATVSKGHLRHLNPMKMCFTKTEWDPQKMSDKKKQPKEQVSTKCAYFNDFTDLPSSPYDWYNYDDEIDFEIQNSRHFPRNPFCIDNYESLKTTAYDWFYVDDNDFDQTGISTLTSSLETDNGKRNERQNRSLTSLMNLITQQ